MSAVREAFLIFGGISAAFLTPVVACTPGQPASSAQESSGAESSPTETDPASVPEEGSEEQSPAEGPVPEQQPEDTKATPSGPSGQELCEQLCQRVKENCKPESAKFCLPSCPDYQEAWERCPVEVEEALTCQMNSEAFLLCSSVASEQCAPFYQAMTDCREGRAEPKSKKQVESADLPAGWHRVRFASLGGSYALPTGEVTKKGPARIVERDGQEFRIEPLASVPDKYDAKSILRLATAYVGQGCEKKLRLHGRYETGSIIHVRFTTLCESPKGSVPWEGIFHLSPGRGIAASVRPSSGTAPVPDDADTFYFGFEPASSE